MPTGSDRRRILDVNSPRVPEGSALHIGVAEVVGQDSTAVARKPVPRANPNIAALDLKYEISTKVAVSPTQMDVRDIADETVAQPTSGAFL